MKRSICPEKGHVRFAHYQRAAKRLAQVNRPRADGTVQTPQSIYRCDHCKGWHLCSYTPEQNREIKELLQRSRRKGRR